MLRQKRRGETSVVDWLSCAEDSRRQGVYVTCVTWYASVKCYGAAKMPGTTTSGMSVCLSVRRIYRHTHKHTYMGDHGSQWRTIKDHKLFRPRGALAYCIRNSCGGEAYTKTHTPSGVFLDKCSSLHRLKQPITIMPTPLEVPVSSKNTNYH